MSEPNELVDGYDPADPPQGEHWCSECSAWDDDCVCDRDDDQNPEPFTTVWTNRPQPHACWCWCDDCKERD